MSKINELIKEMCPNGVEYKNIKELCRENFWVMPSTPNYQNEGIPYITSKNIKNGKVMFDNVKYITENDYKSISSNRTIKENDFLISMIGTIGEVGIVKKKDLPFYGQNMYLLRLNVDLINIKYFYHYFTSSMVRNLLIGEKNNGNQGYLKTKNIEMLKVPVPPLEIQEEIVKILDKFGELEAKLEAELEAELEARKSQYEFWRGTIISNSNGKDGKLIELLSGPITDGPHTTPKFVSEGIPFISASAVHEGKIHLKDAQGFITKAFDNECSRKYKPRKWDVYMVKSGSTTGKVAIVDIDADFNIWSPLAAMRTDNEITSRYLYHLLQTKDVQEQVRNRMSHGSQPNLSMRVLEQFDIKIPTLEEQHCIVNILDKFDKLINDISKGLPAEIELRRKQYEYYRNKLLSFEVCNDE